MKLVSNAAQVARYSISQWAQYVALSIIGGYQALPIRWQDAIPMYWVVALACIALVLGIVGRLIYQPILHAPPQNEVNQ
jgi:hypothetical protein